jgi:hypothetical protein
VSGLGSGGSYGEWGVWYVKKVSRSHLTITLIQTNYINTYLFYLVYYNNTFIYAVAWRILIFKYVYYTTVQRTKILHIDESQIIRVGVF